MADTAQIIIEAVDKASGVFADIGASIGNLGTLAGGVAVAGVTAASAAVIGSTKAYSDWAGQLDDIGDVLGTNANDSAALAVAINGVGGNVDAITGQMAKFTTGLFNAKGELGPTGQLLTSLGVAFQGANGEMLPATQIIQNVADKLSTMPDGLQKTDAMVQLFGKSGKGLTDTLNALTTQGFAAAQQKAKDFGLAIGDEGVNSAIEAGKAQKDFEMMLKGLAITIGSEVLPAIVPLAKEIIAFAREYLPPVIQALKDFGASLAGAATSSDGILNQLLPAIKSVVLWITENWPKIKPILDAFGAAFGFVINQIILPVLGKLLEAAKMLIEWFINNWPEIMKVVGPIVEALGKELIKVRDYIITAFDQAMMVGQKIGEIKTAVETKWGEIRAFVENLPAAFVAAGQNIIQGLINGVVSKLKAFGDIWQKLSTDPIKALQDAMNMHSPSQVMFDAGENIMKGLIYGVLSYRNKAVQMMSDTAQAITDAAAPPAVNNNITAGQDAFDRGGGRLGGALVPAMAAAGAGMTGSLPQTFNATMTINVMMDGAVLASTVVSIVQGILQQEKQRYGQP